LKPLKNVVSVLHKLSSASAVDFGQHLGLPLPPVKAIHTGLGILLSAVKGVLDDYDTLADLLESVEHFLNRLDIYTKIPPTVSMTEIIIKILVELLSTLALATKQLQQGKLKALVKKKLLGGKDIDAVVQRLDRLTEDKARITAAQTSMVFSRYSNNRRTMFAARSCRCHSPVCAAATFRSAVSSVLLDCREICEGEELAALSRASVCAASRILSSVASFL